MPIYLHGLALQFYKGIGSDTQKLAPFKDFNFFIGANNAGKSTVLSFIAERLEGLNQIGLGGQPKAITSLEQYRGRVTGKMSMAIGIPLEEFQKACLRTVGNQNYVSQAKLWITEISNVLAKKKTIWLTNSVPYESSFKFDEAIQLDEIKRAIHPSEWQALWSAVTSQSMGAIGQHWIPETLARFLSAQNLNLPPVRLIPAIREVGPKGAAFNDFSGQGLIDRLAEIQSPDHDKRHERQLFDKINSFLQTVTGREQASIEIPHNREHILVHMDNKVLPLMSLGTGIHEVIMLAAFCTLSENQIVCIEEPEIHLHPLLQRKLIAYLKENTCNQYFIATHSAAFIDTPGAAIFHVTNDGDQTRISESILRSERYSICQDLGYRASDILQANAVIWVEGPSDRIYINHWIAAVAGELVEGIHYSIMFYGGRLLSHLSADANDVKEFIALRSLNRNLAIVMDSDKTSSRDQINATKERLKKEFASDGGVAWVTKGREIENYVGHVILQKAVQATYPLIYSKPAAGGVFDHALYFERLSAKRRRKKAESETVDLIERDVDKVNVARLVCESPADLRILDLEQRVNELVSMIRRANAN